MRQGTIVVTPPTGQPLSVADAKRQLRIEPAEVAFDAEIAQFCTAAYRFVEERLGYPIMQQERMTYADGFPPCRQPLWLGAGQTFEVVEAKYMDASGVMRTMAVTDYAVDGISRPARIYPAAGKDWPATIRQPNAVVIKWRAGWEEATHVPADIIHAMKLMVAHFDQNREAVVTGGTSMGTSTQLELAVSALLAPHRLHGFG